MVWAMDQFLELRNASDYMCQINVVITTKVPYLHTDSDLGIFDCKSVRLLKCYRCLLGGRVGVDRYIQLT